MANTSQKKTAPKKSVKASPTTKTAETRSPAKFTVVKNNSLPELLVSSVKETFWAENHLVASLPKMIAAAADQALKNSLQEHLELTKQHARRLEEVLQILSADVLPSKCDAIEGLVMSGEAAIENSPAGSEVRDTSIIMSALKVENFEVTTYNGLISLANKTGQQAIVKLLQQNLADEEQARDILTGMSQA